MTAVLVALTLAQVAPEPGATALPWWAQALIAISGTVTAFLLAQLGRALGMLFSYLAAKTHLARLAEVDELIMGYVSEVAQSTAAELKADAEDGQLTPIEKARLQRIPIDKLIAHKGLSWLTQLLGGQLESYLQSRVERAVVLHKAGAANPR